jgi:hypothetical protein
VSSARPRPTSRATEPRDASRRACTSPQAQRAGCCEPRPAGCPAPPCSGRHPSPRRPRHTRKRAGTGAPPSRGSSRERADCSPWPRSDAPVHVLSTAGCPPGATSAGADAPGVRASTPRSPCEAPPTDGADREVPPPADAVPRSLAQVPRCAPRPSRPTGSLVLARWAKFVARPSPKSQERLRRRDFLKADGARFRK